MIETLLRGCLESPARRWIVMIVILGIAVAVILPTADQYIESRQCRGQLRAGVAKIRHEVAGLGEVRRQAGERRKRLAELESLAVPGDQVYVFRQEVVDWARNAGCQIRRIRVGTPRSQPWKEGNSPLESTANKPQNVDSGYVLRMQPLSLLVSGRLTNVKGLLAQLRSTDRLVQSRKLSLHSTREDPNQLVLEIELMLFDLTKAEAPTG